MGSKKEKVFQDSVIGMFKERGGHAVNVEPGITNPGMPDVNWCLAGIEGNIELKYGFLEGAAPTIRPNQIVWFRERIKAKGLPMFGYYLEGEVGDLVLIFQGRHYEQLARAKDVDEIYDIPHKLVGDPNEFVDVLIGSMMEWHDEIDPPAKIIT